MQNSARIIEVFSSIQGEGIYVGRPHLFVRFWNCNLACHYCDTDYKGPYQEMTREQLCDEVGRFLREEGPFHAVSLTGGEPLLWAPFLKGWLPWLKEMGQRTYLETNGTLPDALEELLPWIDIIAMDVKPPSATADRPVWEELERFLRTAHAGAARAGAESRPELFVKVVVTPETADEEVARSAHLVAAVDCRIPVVLQPVTPWGEVAGIPSAEQVARWKRLAGRELADVRVLPQVHRLLGVR